MGFWDHWKWRGGWERHVSLWYHPYYEAPSLASIAQSLGMISQRGKRVLASLARSGLVKAGQLRSFPLIPLADLGLFHGPLYLNSVSRHETLARIFGAHVDEVKVDELLSATRWAVSGTLAAARSALAGPAPLALNLGGGFHHAEPDMGSGFCVFNDVGVAIRKLRQEGFHENIAILDLDFHQGNGNLVGFLDDPTVHCYSLHGATWTEKEGSGHFNFNLKGSVADATYLQALEESLPAFLDRHSPALVFYIAGHDVLDKDPLGEFHLSLEGTRRRDRYVLRMLRERRIPGVITLAGGYSLQACQAALDLALTAMEEERPLAFERKDELAPKFRRLLASIDPLGAPLEEDAWSLSEEDLWPGASAWDSDAGKAPSVYEAERALEQCGVLDKLRQRGLEDIRVSLACETGGDCKLEVKARQRGKLRSRLETVAEFELPPETLREPEKLRSSLS